MFLKCHVMMILKQCISSVYTLTSSATIAVDIATSLHVLTHGDWNLVMPRKLLGF